MFYIKYKLLCCLLVLPFWLAAQTQITGDGFARIGDQAVYDCDTTSHQYKFSSFGQPWLMTKLNSDYQSVMSFTSMQTSPYAAQFSMANLCLYTDSSYFFLAKQTDKIELLGIADQSGNLPFPVSLDNPLTYMTFPVHLGNSFEDESTITIEDTPDNLGIDVSMFPLTPDFVRIKGNMTITAQTNAEATLSTPVNQYSSTLQQRRVQTLNLTIDIKAYGFWVNNVEEYSEQLTTYFFLSSDEPTPVLTFDVSNDSIQNINYIKSGGATVGCLFWQTSPLIFHTSEELIVENITAQKAAQQLDIYTLTGELLFSNSTQATRYIVPLEFLESGIYIAMLKDHRGQCLARYKWWYQSPTN